MQIAKLQANLARIELACGGNAKAKAAAQRALDEANAMEAEINAMLHTN
jgi:iron-sulfur cluster repair protein YtfE (RIC family)